MEMKRVLLCALLALSVLACSDTATNPLTPQFSNGNPCAPGLVKKGSICPVTPPPADTVPTDTITPPPTDTITPPPTDTITPPPTDTVPTDTVTPPPPPPAPVDTTLRIYAQCNFDNSTTCNFGGAGLLFDPTCPNGVCSNGISIVDNPDGSGDKVVQVRYNRADTTFAADVNRGIQSRTMSVGLGQTLYVEWDVMLEYPDTAGCGATTIYNRGSCMLNTQRKLLYLQTQGNVSPIVFKFHGGNCGGTTYTCTHPLQFVAKNLAGTSMPITVEQLPEAQSWGVWHHFTIELTMNTAPTVADGHVKITRNGAVLVDRNDIHLLTDTRPIILTWIGQQVSVATKDMLYDELRWLNNAVVANKRPN